MAVKHPVCKADDIPVGGKKIVNIGSRRVGVFNVAGDFFAMLDICPHQGASICEGPICGTNLPVDGYEYQFGMENELIRCSRHGWEFNIRTGECIGDKKIKAKTYPAEVKNGQVVVTV